MITDNMLLIKTEIIDEVTTRNGRISRKLFNKFIVPHIKELEKENQLLRDELEKEREVVDFYAHDDNWVVSWAEPCDVVDRDNLESGKRARQRINERKELN